MRSIIANLTPASGRQDHTTSPSASKRVRHARRLRPPHPAPTSVTIAIRPSVRTGRRDDMQVIWVKREPKYFLRRTVMTEISLKHLRKLALTRGGTGANSETSERGFGAFTALAYDTLRFTALRRVSSIRDCQPAPVDLKCSITSGLRRSDTSFFVGDLFGPRPFRIEAARSGKASANGLARAKSSFCYFNNT